MVQELNLREIIDRCAQEADRQRAQERGYCFELFRRAVDQQDQEAWIALERQYRQLMISWVQAYPTGGQPAEEIDGTLQEALERFWRTLTKRGVSRDFAHVGALLKYLRQCVIATILDQQRRRQRRERLVERLASAPEALLMQNSFEEATLVELAQSEQILRVRRWIREEVSDPQEQRILALSYEDELSPAEIAARFPAEFGDASTVRRIKERVLKRARRALAQE
jgi:RNA polymerase sigma factor (sigma-70 family)